MFFRILVESDAYAFHNLRLAALKECPYAFASSFEEESKKTPDEIKRNFKGIYSSSNNFILGAFDDKEQLIGMAGFYQEHRLKTCHKGNIWGVYVTSESRNKGIARQLMSHTLSVIRQLPSVEQINISVTASNTPARNLYASLGFTTYGIEPNAIKYNEKYVDDELMVLFL